MKKVIVLCILFAFVITGCSSSVATKITLSSANSESGEFLDKLNINRATVLFRINNNHIKIDKIVSSLDDYNLREENSKNIRELFKTKRARTLKEIAKDEKRQKKSDDARFNKHLNYGCLEIIKGKRYETCSIGRYTDYLFHKRTIKLNRETIGSWITSPLLIPLTVLDIINPNLNESRTKTLDEFIDNSTKNIIDLESISKIGNYIDNKLSLELKNIYSDSKKLSDFINKYKALSLVSKSSYMKSRLLKLYRKENSFMGYMNAFKISFLDDDLEKAYKMSSVSDLDKSYLNTIYYHYVKSLSGLKSFSKYTKKIDRYKKKPYYKKIIKLKGFGDNLTIDNFLHSTEYQNVLKNINLKVGAKYDEKKYYLKIKAFDKQINLIGHANCKYKRKISSTEDLGFWEGLGNSMSGGKVKNKTIYKNMYECFPKSSDLKEIKKIDLKLTSGITNYNWLKSKSGWSYKEYSGKDYNKFSGSNGGVRYINKNGKNLWGVICNNGASGTITIDRWSDGGSISSICASGANQRAECKSPNDWSVNQAGNYLCK